MKMIFLEGLPLSGKTTIINRINERHIKNVFTVDEIITECKNGDQESFMKNDLKKINKYKNGTIIIDRGLISTLSYNETLTRISSKVNDKVIKWFIKYGVPLYESDFVTTYFLDNEIHSSRESNNNDPYGNLDNLKLLKEITISNIKKYCKNYKIIDYNYNNIEEVINEIVN